MKLLDTINRPHGTNAWGRSQPSVEKIYLVEEEDRCIRDHYRGYDYSFCQIEPGDIICVYEYSGITSWIFAGDQTKERYRDKTCS
jgi:hypothetical protein